MRIKTKIIHTLIASALLTAQLAIFATPLLAQPSAPIEDSVRSTGGSDSGELYQFVEDEGPDFALEDPPALASTTEGSVSLVCADDGPVGNNEVASPIMCTLIDVVNFLSIGVAVVAAASVAVAGMQYVGSQGNPNKTKQATDRLITTGSAILLYVFGWALLNWIVPGGMTMDAVDGELCEAETVPGGRFGLPRGRIVARHGDPDGRGISGRPAG